MTALITLLTDFGLEDPFVGVMKGVVFSRCPEARVVDLTHGLSPQNVLGAAFWLERSFRWFPEGTVHVAVVDPTVGSRRRALAARAHGHLFVAPDNGLVEPILASDPGSEAREIDCRALQLVVASKTFHGRDVFAPVGAELASGRVAFEGIGPVLADPVELPGRAPIDVEGGVDGRIMVVDRFGNLISNVPSSAVPARGPTRVRIAGRSIPTRATYADVEIGELVALVGSLGTIEVAVRDGSAARLLETGPGEAVELRRE